MVKDSIIEEAAKAVRRERAFVAAAAFGVPSESVGECAELIARAALEAAAPLIARRDEYHTMDELYEYRMLYNALAANLMPDKAVKSWRHSDGEECFGGGWFVVYLNSPAGQISNHYKAEHWDLFRVPEAETAPEYDGHTPADAAQRLREALPVVAPLIAAESLAGAWDEGHRAGWTEVAEEWADAESLGIGAYDRTKESDYRAPNPYCKDA